jgi:uncharacterized protein (DUF58 family)
MSLLNPGAANTSSPINFSARFQRWLNKRIPSQPSIILSQRSIFILPSKTGLAFCVLLILLLLLAINYQNALIYGLTFMLVSVLLITILHTFRNLSGLRLELIASQPGYVGDNIEFEIKISKTTDSYHDNIQLSWPNCLKQHARLNYQDSDTVHLFIPAKQRGWQRPGRLLVETLYPLGLIRAWTWIDFGAVTIAYPKPIFGSSLTTSPVLKEEGHNGCFVGSDDFHQMRNYQEGDPLKHIAWRSYARTDQLMVKEFSSHQENDVMLDWFQMHGDIESRLSQLTGLAIEANRKDIEFGLRLPTLEIPPACGQLHLNSVLKHLALYGS